MKTLVVLTGVFLTCGSAVRASETYTRETEAWRQVRVAELTAPDGWLTLVGLHFLREGENRIGSAPDSDVVLPSGPALLGTATLGAANKVSLNLAPDVDARIDGAAVRQAELKSDADSGKPTLVTSGTIRFFIIDRGGKKAVRVKDSDAAPRRHFPGLDYFPIDPRWRIEARWEPFENCD